MSYEDHFQISNKKQLSQHTKAFLLQGASCTGSFRDGLMMNEEHIFISEPYTQLEDFCDWIDHEIGGAGQINIDRLWIGFQNQEAPIHAKFIAETQKTMLKYKNL